LVSSVHCWLIAKQNCMTLNGLFIISLLTVLVAIITTIAVSHSGGSYLYDQFLRSDNVMGQLLSSDLSVDIMVTLQ